MGKKYIHIQNLLHILKFTKFLQYINDIDTVHIKRET